MERIVALPESAKPKDYAERKDALNDVSVAVNTIAESFAQDTTIYLALCFPNRRMSAMSVCGEENAKQIEPTTLPSKQMLWQGEYSRQALEEIIVETENNQKKTEDQNITPDYLINPKMDMPKLKVNKNYYVGYLEIPALNLKLPVLDTLTYDNLNISPCRYKGSVYLDNMVIAAHNFRSHFGNISQLSIGDEIVFTDIDGNVFVYEVADFESLRGSQVEDMVNSDSELTLFTCNYDGSARVTVRCHKN